MDVYQLNRKDCRLEDISEYRHTVRQDFITCVESFEANLEILRSTDAKMMQSRSRSFPIAQIWCKISWLKDHPVHSVWMWSRKRGIEVKTILEMRQQRVQLKGRNGLNTEGLGGLGAPSWLPARGRQGWIPAIKQGTSTLVPLSFPRSGIISPSRIKNKEANLESTQAFFTLRR